MILFNKPLLSISNNKKQCISVLNPTEFTVFVLYYHLASKFNLLIAISQKFPGEYVTLSLPIVG